MTEASMKHLAAAIVDRAVADWHKAVSRLEDNPDYVYAWADKDEIERFFESEWFELLCEISPDLTKIHLQEARTCVECNIKLERNPTNKLRQVSSN